MKKKKVFIFMEVMTEGERRQFIEWLKVELNGSQQIILDLATFLFKEYPAFYENDELSNYLNNKYPKIKINITKYTSILTYYIELYLSFKSLKKNQSDRETLLIRELEERNPPEAFEWTHKKSLRTLHQEPLSEDYFKKAWQLFHSARTYRIKHNFKSEEGELPRMDQLVDGRWAYQKIILLNSRLIDAYLYKRPVEVLDDLKVDFAYWRDRCDDLGSKPTVLEVYEEAFLLLLDRDGSKAPKMMGILHKAESAHIHASDLRNVFGLLLNYGIRQLNVGKSAMGDRMLLMYEWGIQHKVVYQGKYLMVVHYRNLINICLRQGKEQQARTYLEDLKADLSPREQKATYVLVKAGFHFRKQEFKEVVQLLENWKSPGIREYLIGHTYLLEAHYEVRDLDTEDLIRMGENLLKYIRKHRHLSKRFKDPYILRFRFFNRFLKMSLHDEFVAFRKLVEAEKQLPNQQWLLDKIDEKINRFQL